MIFFLKFLIVVVSCFTHGFCDLWLLALIHFCRFLTTKYVMVHCLLSSNLPRTVSASNAIFSIYFFFICGEDCNQDFFSNLVS
jgi:hypothetical protein